MYIHIYGHTLFDTVRPLVSCWVFFSTNNINFVGDKPVDIATKLGINLASGFREEDSNVKIYGRRRTPIDDNTSHDPLGQVS